VTILAIETSSDVCSCALRFADGSVLQRRELAPRQHASLLLPMVESVLAQAKTTLAQVQAVAYGCGPGSFTGVRIAACVAQGLALAVARPVVAVSSLAALALQAAPEHARVLAALDARMGEVYLGAFTLTEDGALELSGREQLARPESVDLPASGTWLGIGPGWRSHGATLAPRLGARIERVLEEPLPAASQVAALAVPLLAAGAGRPAAQAAPGYLRRRVATPRRRET
jgi:tRNA threonylcarbamoyladenosine biosynthesis protein TsaB